MSQPAPANLLTDSQKEEFRSLADAAARKTFLDANPSLQTADIVHHLCQWVWSEVRVSTTQAMNIAEAAIAISENLGDTLSLAKSFRAKGNALYSAGDNAAAIAAHQRAIELFEQSGNRDELARSLSTSIQPLLLNGNYDDAFRAADRARAIFAEDGNLWRIARLEINVGNIYHRQDRFAEAMACYERAYEGLKERKDAEGLAAVLSNMATCFITLNAFAKALETYENARQFCEANGMPLLVAQADYNIAYLYYLRGEYIRAIQMLRAARTRCKKVGDEYHYSLCNLDLSELYLELNLSKEAAELAQEGFGGFEKLGLGYEAAKCLAFRGIAAGQEGRGFEAIQEFTRAKEIFIREKNQVWPSLIDLYQALVLFQEGRHFEARRLCLAARERFVEGGLSGKAILADLLMVRIALATEDLADATQRADGAVAELEKVESPVLAYQAYFLLGQTRRAKGDKDGAYAAYETAKSSLETLRSSLRGEELKIAFLKNRLEVYENLVELCLERGVDRTEEAFSLIEQAKSRSLMDLFLQPLRSAVETDHGQSELARSIRTLREELNWYYNLIEREQLQPEERSQEKIATLQRQARARESDLIRVLQEASLRDAEQAGVQTPTNMELRDIRETLPERAAIVEYYQVRDRIMACLVTRTSVQVFPVTIEGRISKLLRLLQFQLSKFRFDADYLATFQSALLTATNAHLKELHSELLGSFESQIEADHLIVVPHGLLHYVPFHALYDGENYLCDRYTISYAPSASIHSLCERRQVNSTQEAVILGVPDAQAPAIQDEVEAIAAVLPGSELFLGNAASEDILRSRGPNSRMVHIATHGYFRQDNAMFSAIRLGGSFMNLYDLYQLRMPAELVVLSGCATGLNVVAAGDELIGLARGLLHAGAQSLMLSLWDVHDASTAEFMTTFYRSLGVGAPKAKAMQTAMQETRKRYPHPYQWAPFILVGKL